MKVLIVGINYAPEPVGIGPYTAGTAEYLAAAGHEVSVVSGKAYYPYWKIDPAFLKPGTISRIENGVEIHRVPLYVPAKPSGLRRLIHHASFTLSALPAAIRAGLKRKPDVVFIVAPSLISVVTARFVARLFSAKLWLHVQDFEVEAAFATGLLTDGGLAGKLARAFEKWTLKANIVSTISPQMLAKLRRSGTPETQVYEFRNWANIESIQPLESESEYRKEWNITTPHVALYSGNIGSKQGIEIIVAVARLLQHRRDLTFVICGNGSSRERLMQAAQGLDNIRFADLQPAERMSELLGLATLHLLPQIAGAADLVLPSKLTNMLASGRPVVATADPGTGLAAEVEGCGLVTPPEDAAKLAQGIETLIADTEMWKRCAAQARLRAEERWSRSKILADFEKSLCDRMR